MIYHAKSGFLPPPNSGMRDELKGPQPQASSFFSTEYGRDGTPVTLGDVKTLTSLISNAAVVTYSNGTVVADGGKEFNLHVGRMGKIPPPCPPGYFQDGWPNGASRGGFPSVSTSTDHTSLSNSSSRESLIALRDSSEGGAGGILGSWQRLVELDDSHEREAEEGRRPRDAASATHQANQGHAPRRPPTKARRRAVHGLRRPSRIVDSMIAGRGYGSNDNRSTILSRANMRRHSTPESNLGPPPHRDHCPSSPVLRAKMTAKEGVTRLEMSSSSGSRDDLGESGPLTWSTVSSSQIEGTFGSSSAGTTTMGSSARTISDMGVSKDSLSLSLSLELKHVVGDCNSQAHNGDSKNPASPSAPITSARSSAPSSSTSRSSNYSYESIRSPLDFNSRVYNNVNGNGDEQKMGGETFGIDASRIDEEKECGDDDEEDEEEKKEQEKEPKPQNAINDTCRHGGPTKDTEFGSTRLRPSTEDNGEPLAASPVRLPGRTAGSAMYSRLRRLPLSQLSDSDGSTGPLSEDSHISRRILSSSSSGEGEGEGKENEEKKEEKGRGRGGEGDGHRNSKNRKSGRFVGRFAVPATPPPLQASDVRRPRGGLRPVAYTLGGEQDRGCSVGARKGSGRGSSSRVSGLRRHIEACRTPPAAAAAFFSTAHHSSPRRS